MPPPGIATTDKENSTLLFEALFPIAELTPDHRVTASTGVPVYGLDFLTRGWILAERKRCSKGKFVAGTSTSHRRFTTFPQPLNHLKIMALSKNDDSSVDFSASGIINAYFGMPQDCASELLRS
jgi:hypothetical protein